MLPARIHQNIIDSYVYHEELIENPSAIINIIHSTFLSLINNYLTQLLNKYSLFVTNALFFFFLSFSNALELELNTQCVVEMDQQQTILRNPASIEKIER